MTRSRTAVRLCLRSFAIVGILAAPALAIAQDRSVDTSASNYQAAAAPEAWDTEFGEVVYDRDIGTWAVWRFGPAGGGPGAGKIFIDRLGGVTSGRGGYGGYWMFYDSPDKPCAEARSDIEGNVSQNYGTFQLTFLDPEPPARWSAEWGVCDSPATTAWNGTPKATAAAQPPPAAQAGSTGGGWLGVRLQTVTPEIAESLGMTRATGAIVTAVEPGSPAAEAGVAAGDVIWRANGTETASSRDLAPLIGALAPGSVVALGIVRAGSLVDLSVTLAPRPEPSQSSESSNPPMPTGDRPGDAEDDTIVRFGNLVVMPITPLTRSIFGLADDLAGLVVTAAAANGKAFLYAPAGTVIIEAGGIEAPTIEQLRAAIAAQSAAGSRPLLLRILQPSQHSTIFVALDLGELSDETAGLLTSAGVAYDRGAGVVFSTELAARHLLAAVAAGEAGAVALLTDRPATLNQTTREIIQRRLADAGHYQGAIDGVFGPSTRRAVLDHRSGG